MSIHHPAKVYSSYSKYPSQLHITNIIHPPFISYPTILDLSLFHPSIIPLSCLQLAFLIVMKAFHLSPFLHYPSSYNQHLPQCAKDIPH